jgi:glycosyltransferase involved in cell wall biosynthesis
LDAVDACRRPGDRVVIARAEDSEVEAPRLSSGRCVDAEEVGEDDVLALAAEHARDHGGPTVILDSGAFGFGNRWIGDLGRDLETHGLVAPVTNADPWPNAPLDLPDARASRAAWRKFARSLEWKAVETLAIADVAAVASPCVALSPATALALAGGMGGTIDLNATALAHAASGLGITVSRSHHVYVHVDVEVILSASLIIKNEVENLDRCLRSLLPVVDEIVIYDTGSTDGSVELARRYGATVIEGHWDDDFARARNEAGRACRGVWLLIVDADEEVEYPLETASSLRDALREDIPYDVANVPVYNMFGTELAPTRNPNAIDSTRIVHRTRCCWSGALHEQPLLVRGHRVPRGTRLSLVTVLHHGYIDEVFQRRGKGERNSRIAETRLKEFNDPARVHYEIGRTYMQQGRHDESLAEFLLAAETAETPENHRYRRRATERVALYYLRAGDLTNAHRWTESRAEIPEKPGVARWLRAELALAEGDPLAVLGHLDEITDFDDARFAGHEPIHLLRAVAHVALEDLDAAGREIIAALTVNPVYDAAWVALISLAYHDRRLLDEAAVLVPEEQLKLFAGKLLSAPPATAGLMAEAMWAHRRHSATLLALGATLAPMLDLESAATWAVRVRGAGHVDLCPLRAIADDDRADPARRLQAAYLGAEMFDDALLRRAVEDLSAALPVT